MAEPDLNKPTVLLSRFQRGQRIPAKKLNEAIDAINRQGTGVSGPQQVHRKGKEAATGIPLSCRLLVTDANTTLQGFSDIDGRTPEEGDLILVSIDSDLDGVYQIPKSGGPWQRVAKLSLLHGDDKVPVYTKGDLISVWDGDSAPTVYMACVDDTLEET